jgi:hypothetical protein
LLGFSPFFFSLYVMGFLGAYTIYTGIVPTLAIWSIIVGLFWIVMGYRMLNQFYLITEIVRRHGELALNETAAKIPQLEQEADTAALQKALEAAKNWPPKRPPEMTPGNYRVIYSDGVTQETCLIPAEIEKWVIASNKAEADKPYRIVRVLDAQGHVVWGEPDQSSPEPSAQ